MEFQLFQVAAFTQEMFGGNPAAVVPLREWIDDDSMQKIAAENNLSETAFFVPLAESEWQIRWFTPTVEVPLCGHATLASVAVIHQKMNHAKWPITLQSASGPLMADKDGDVYVLDLPANKPLPADIPPGLEDAMGARIREFHIGHDLYMAVMQDESSVAQLEPDFAALASLVEHGIIATAEGNDVDFVSRFFAPAIGIDEDPVTGAAHCVLTPFWSERLGKKQLRARQISSRVGYLDCADDGERVRLSGAAVFFLSGTIHCNDKSRR